jgi:hypothetical protein
MHEIESYKAREALLNSGALSMDDVFRLNETDLAHTFLHAAIMGRVPLMKVLREQRGPIPVNFENTAVDPFRLTLNGRGIDLDLRYTLRHITNSGQLKVLFSSIREYGMKGLLEPGPTYPLLLRNIDKTVKRRVYKASEFTGALPELRANVLSKPELAIALHEESEGPVTPDAYKPILCWATRDMMRQYPDRLAPLKHVQTVNEKYSMQDWKAKYNPDAPVDAKKIDVGVELTLGNSEYAEFLFSVMGPANSRVGFPDDTGRILCETSTDFLMNFPTVNHSSENDVAARTFVGSYCPFEIIALQAARVCVREFGHEAPVYAFEKHLQTTFLYGKNELFEMLGSEHPLHLKVREMMRKEQWMGLIRDFNSNSATVKTLLALRDAFGLDNTGLPVHLNRSDVTELIKDGYRFADDTRAFECADDLAAARYDFRNRLTAVLLDFNGSDWRPQYGDQMPMRLVQDIFIKQYQEIMSINLWPAPIPRPPDIKTALDCLVVHDNGDPLPRENTVWALRAYVVTAGMEACMAAAAPEHWERLIDVFPKDAFKPYIKTLPGRARGLLLEAELGL